MKLIAHKSCGCRVYRYANGIEVNKLCGTHTRMVVQGKDIK